MSERRAAATGAIVDFLEGKGVDGAGRLIARVLEFGLGDLERHHDFIQWLFPLAEASNSVPKSPVLSPADIEAIRESRLAQMSLVAASGKMAWFYTETEHWLRPSNHNHLRITRIIKSLRLLKGDLDANAFRRHILSRAKSPQSTVSDASVAYWMAA